MKYLLLPVIALGIGTAAYAHDYPPCSRTVQDECTGPVSHHATRSHKSMREHHAALHHGAKDKTARS